MNKHSKHQGNPTLDNGDGLDMKTFVVIFSCFMIGACAATNEKTVPGVYKLVGDGLWEITVSGTTELPTGSEVATINFREILDSAAASKCPVGYEILKTEPAGLSASSDGRRLEARQKGLVKCH